MYASRFHQVGNSMIGFLRERWRSKRGAPLDYKPRRFASFCLLGDQRAPQSCFLVSKRRQTRDVRDLSLYFFFSLSFSSTVQNYFGMDSYETKSAAAVLSLTGSRILVAKSLIESAVSSIRIDSLVPKRHL